MIILALETSCDETAAAVIRDGRHILSNVVASQMKRHSQYGGVIPELAARMHAEKIDPVVRIALEQADISLNKVDLIAGTTGPGLEGALLVGACAAKTLAHCNGKPFVSVNHLYGHIYASFLENDPPSFPFICLIVSGGHSLLLLVRDHFNIELLGQTRDDAAGEAFDKVARYLDLGYPGGPRVEAQAKHGNASRFRFPRAMLKEGYEFSFSGLKTAVIQTVQQLEKENEGASHAAVNDICASFQSAVVDVLAYKTLKACTDYGVSQLVVSGGVACNGLLREAFSAACRDRNIALAIPRPELCTDNAAMIAAAAYYHYQTLGPSPLTTTVNPAMAL